MAASKQGRTYVNTLPQCSPTSVGLAQACPNNGYIGQAYFVNSRAGGHVLRLKNDVVIIIPVLIN